MGRKTSSAVPPILTRKTSPLCYAVTWQIRAILITYAGVLLQAQKCFSQSFDTTLTPNGRLSEILKLRYSLCHSLYSNTKLLYYNEENMSIVFVKKILLTKRKITTKKAVKITAFKIIVKSII